MSLTAILFPGQGSQSAGMRDTVARARPDLLALACEVVGEDPFARVEEGTQFAQPAIFCASLAGWEELGRPSGDYMAGHSLGELAALVAAGCLEERAGLELVALRGRLMQHAGEAAARNGAGAAARNGPAARSGGAAGGRVAGPAGGMLALLGPGAAERAPELAQAHGLAVANDNCPTQVVLSGRRERLPAAAAAAAQLGLRAIELPVTGAFHSPLMKPARRPFAAALERVPVRPARVPVMSAVTAQPFDDVRLRLAEALTSPVRWRETLLELRRRGVERFIEVGPGRVLTGLVKRTLEDVELVHA
jgi:[acyl-carrier-protein] S-malonyltransferase